MVERTIVFSGSPLDRASLRRKDDAWLQEHLRAPGSRFLALHRLNALVRTGEVPALAWAGSEIYEFADPDSAVILLGVHEDTAHFAVDVSALEEPELRLGLGADTAFLEVRSVAGKLPSGEGGILAQARSMLDWHATHRFCAACGTQTQVAEAGFVRTCPSCQRQHFPRTSPVVIMQIVRGDKCLLARQASWPAGFVSALAGFVEPGETIEEAVRREVMEEAGIRVGEVRYHSSQPWPFPSSLMIGCIAEALSEEIFLDDEELETAAWIERDAVRAALVNRGRGADFSLPPPMAIAHQLVRAWAEGE